MVPGRLASSNDVPTRLEPAIGVYPATVYPSPTMTRSRYLTFVCPGCDESITVDAATRASLIENGCVLCGTTVSRNAFASH